MTKDDMKEILLWIVVFATIFAVASGVLASTYLGWIQGTAIGFMVFAGIPLVILRYVVFTMAKF